ncbi:MAG TPA: YDG domain-containing protein, partial [bacterium]|nr:YDG domain-containing protein [bacterium]
SCSVLGAHTEAGVYPIVCAGGVDDKYQFSYSSGTLTVRKIAQTISFGELSAKVYGADDFELVASASSGLTVSFAATNEVCGVSGQTVHINRVGECVITAVQNGSNNYEAAPAVTRSFVITKKDLAVSGLAVNNKIYDGTDVASLNLADLSLVGLIDGGVTVNTEGVIGRFDNKNIGTEKLVTVGGLTLLGEQAANYNLSQPTARASIAKRELVVTAVTDTKIYDGLASSTKVPVLSSGSLASGDTAAWTQSFESATVGANKKLIASGVVSDTNGGNNYQLSFVENETGVISEVLSAPVVESAAPVVEVKSLVGGGAILNSECKELRLSDWSVCRESRQSRVVIDRTPANCLISEVQKLSLQRDCSSEVPQVLGQKIYPDGSFLKGS